MPRPTRREREKERHRNEILDAAERVFAKKSFHEATMAEIATEAEFAIGSLYNFFSSKDDLYLAMLDRVGQDFMSRFRQEVEAAPDEVNVLERLMALKREILDKHRVVLRVFFGQALGARWSLDASLSREVRERYVVYVDELAKVFESGIRKKLFRRVDSHDLAIGFEGLTNAFIGEWSQRAQAQPNEDEARAVLELFLSGARA